MGIFTREEFESIIHDNKILDDTGATFVVVDKDLQILYVNYTANEKEGKFSPGDFLNVLMRFRPVTDAVLTRVVRNASSVK